MMRDGHILWRTTMRITINATEEKFKPVLKVRDYTEDQLLGEMTSGQTMSEEEKIA